MPKINKRKIFQKIIYFSLLVTSFLLLSIFFVACTNENNDMQIKVEADNSCASKDLNKTVKPDVIINETDLFKPVEEESVAEEPVEEESLAEEEPESTDSEINDETLEESEQILIKSIEPEIEEELVTQIEKEILEISLEKEMPYKCGQYSDGSYEIYEVKITSCRNLSSMDFFIEKSDNIIVLEETKNVSKTENGTEFSFGFYFTQLSENFLKVGYYDDSYNVLGESEKIYFELEEIVNEIYSLELSSSDELATYDFVADEILVDFSITKAIYFEIKLLKNGEYTGTSTLDAEISDVTFGVFSTPIYNSLYVKLKKVGEFSLIIYDSKYNISRTINVIVR